MRGWGGKDPREVDVEEGEEDWKAPAFILLRRRHREWGQRSISDRMRGCRWWQIICTINGSTIMAVEDESFNGGGGGEEE